MHPIDIAEIRRELEQFYTKHKKELKKMDSGFHILEALKDLDDNILFAQKQLDEDGEIEPREREND